MKQLAISSLALSGAFLFTSCGLSPKPLASTPPAKAVQVQEFSIGDGFLMKKFTFPSGTYRAESEDKVGFYYAPPSGQINVFDTGMKYGSRGGIYWKKGEEKPNFVYVKGNFGMMAPLKKKDMPVTVVR
jgi:hypothetical protein